MARLRWLMVRPITLLVLLPVLAALVYCQVVPYEHHSPRWPGYSSWYGWPLISKMGSNWPGEPERFHRVSITRAFANLALSLIVIFSTLHVFDRAMSKWPQWSLRSLFGCILVIALLLGLLVNDVSLFNAFWSKLGGNVLFLPIPWYIQIPLLIGVGCTIATTAQGIVLIARRLGT